jgi:hypothetical protein
MTKALTGSASPLRINVSKKTGRHTFHLPFNELKIPHFDGLNIAVDPGGSGTKVGIMRDANTIEVLTLPPYVFTEEVPKGASRRLSRESGIGENSGIAAMLTATTDERNQEKSPAVDKNNISFERKGKRIVGGKSAGDLGGKTGLGQSKLELLEEKVIMALILAGIDINTAFKLSISLPYKRETFEVEQSRVPRLFRRLSWTQDGKTYTPDPKVIKVVPEGAHGHLFSMLVDPSLPNYATIKHMNLDGGWREIKGLAFDSTNLNQPSRTQSGIREFGINEAYRRVAEIIGEGNHESPEFVSAVNECLEKELEAPKYFVRSIGESVDLWEVAESVFDDFQDEYIDEAMKLIQPGYNHFCLFGGVMRPSVYGDALVEEIEDRTGGECTIMQPYPEFANVLCQVVDLACSQ